MQAEHAYVSETAALKIRGLKYLTKQTLIVGFLSVFIQGKLQGKKKKRKVSFGIYSFEILDALYPDQLC